MSILLFLLQVIESVSMPVQGFNESVQHGTNSCGCPVVTTSIGGISAVVRKGEGILVEVGDIDAIAEGMKLMLSGEQGLNPARISAPVTERFSREVIGHKLHEAHLRASGRTLNPPEEGSEW